MYLVVGPKNQRASLLDCWNRWLTATTK